MTAITADQLAQRFYPGHDQEHVPEPKAERPFKDDEEQDEETLVKCNCADCDCKTMTSSGKCKMCTDGNHA